MFVEHSTTVEVGLDRVEKELDKMRAVAGQWADAAYREGESLQARVGPTESVATRVDLVIGLPEIHGSGLVYPISWTASGATLLFPELSADLILVKSGLQRTVLTLKGTYQPPLGPIGKLADRVGLRKVADITVRNWMNQLADAIASETDRTGE